MDLLHFGKFPLAQNVVGFWNSEEERHLPDPTSGPFSADKRDDELLDKLREIEGIVTRRDDDYNYAAYDCTLGFSNLRWTQYAGDSWCRFLNCGVRGAEMGDMTIEFCDPKRGVTWVYPIGYRHYLEVHHVTPPPSFRAAVLELSPLAVNPEMQAARKLQLLSRASVSALSMGMGGIEYT